MVNGVLQNPFPNSEICLRMRVMSLFFARTNLTVSVCVVPVVGHYSCALTRKHSFDRADLNSKVSHPFFKFAPMHHDTDKPLATANL